MTAVPPLLRLFILAVFAAAVYVGATVFIFLRAVPAVPVAVVAAALTLAGLWWWERPAALRVRLRADRRRLGLCVSCRYDLRGNVSGICPECGTAKA
jgi:hypothetical protein